MKSNFRIKLLYICFALIALQLCGAAQIPYSLSVAEQEAMSANLEQLKESLFAADQEPGRTTMLLEAIDLDPPATLGQEIPRKPDESYLHASLRRIKTSDGTLFAELRNGQSNLFASLDERIWVAKQYVAFLALVTDTKNRGGELPKVWEGRTSDVISKADEFQLRIIVEIVTHVEAAGASQTEEVERNLWMSSAGNLHSYGRLCTLLVARKAISRQPIFEEMLASFSGENDPNVLDQLIGGILSSGNLVFAKQLADDLLTGNSALSVVQRQRLQEVMER